MIQSEVGDEGRMSGRDASVPENFALPPCI